MSGYQNKISCGKLDSQIPWLDGIRGIAAFWVLASHVQILTGMRNIPFLSWGSLAVDLFMLLSGFLMAHHYLLRQEGEPWNEATTWLAFWGRRVFRIAPLYYTLLLVSLCAGSWIGEYRQNIAAVWPSTATDSSRYGDASLMNILLHLSFIFGAMPEYSFRTPLPDWSIGLEMQFYFAFPAFMICISWFGAARAGLGVLMICFLTWYFFQDFFIQFPMPSFLPMKLYVFFIGIWLAISRNKMSMKCGLGLSVVIATVMAAVLRSSAAIAFVPMVVTIFYLMDNGSLPLSHKLNYVKEKIRLFLSGPIAKFLGDTSYSVYLLHLLIVIPIAGIGASQPWYVGMSEIARFAFCLFLVIPIVYSLGWFLYHFVEKPGIRIGKKIVRRFIAERPDFTGELVDQGK